MIILRLGGDEVDVESLSKLTNLVPYRIERRDVGRSKTNCLFYDVNDMDSLSDALLDLKKFLRQNRIFLDTAHKIDGAITREIDIGLIIPSNIVAKTLTMDAELLKTFGELGLSVSISVYKASESEGETPT